jgi:Zn-dependent protease
MIDEIFLLRIPAILLALTVHEYAHGWVALKSGDDTALKAGRLTLNPLSHLDLFGTLMMLFGPFGWAKPVPINPFRFRSRRRDLVLVSFAGPLSNILCAFLAGMVFRWMVPLGFTSVPYLGKFLYIFFYLNLGLSFFNLLPIPPLDGSNILTGFLPPSKVASYYRMVRKLPLIFMIMLVAEWGLHIPLFSTLIDPLWKPYFSFWQFLFLGRNVP